MILAGGAGTRLWPLSRSATPKHLLRLLGDRTLLRATYERARLVADRILIVTEASQVEAARAELPEIPEADWLVEPGRRGTAACLALAAAALPADGVMVSLHADHLIPDAEAFAAAVRSALLWAGESTSLVTLGVEPRSPATGFGYIHLGDAVAAPGRLPARRGLRFVEKPPVEEAQRMVESGEYVWNSGIFAWRNAVFTARLEAAAPAILAGANRAWGARTSGDADGYAREYLTVPDMAVDHAVMERSDDILVVAAAFPWSDVGSWADLRDVMVIDPDGNAVDGDVLVLDGAGNTVVASDRLVALVGVSDLVVVDTGDALLVVPRERVQDVKLLVAELKRRGRDEVL